MNDIHLKDNCLFWITFITIVSIALVFINVGNKSEIESLKDSNNVLMNSLQQCQADLRSYDNSNLPDCKHPIYLKDGSVLCSIDDIS